MTNSLYFCVLSRFWLNILVFNYEADRFSYLARIKRTKVINYSGISICMSAFVNVFPQYKFGYRICGVTLVAWTKRAKAGGRQSVMSGSEGDGEWASEPSSHQQQRALPAELTDTTNFSSSHLRQNDILFDPCIVLRGDQYAFYKPSLDKQITKQRLW